MRLALVLLLISNVCLADEVSGVVFDRAARSVGGTEVRVVGDAFVVMTTTDASGRFRVRHLPSGTYRIHVAPGLRVIEPAPGETNAVTIDRERFGMCVLPLPPRTFIVEDTSRPLCAVRMTPRHLIAEPLRRGSVETTSTEQGIRIPSPGRLGR